MIDSDGIQTTPLRAVRFCTALGRALHACGIPAMRLENRLETVSAVLGVPGQFFATPTAIMAQYRLPGKRRPYAELGRADPGGVDLGRLADLEAVVDDLRDGRVDLSGAERRVAAIVEAPGRGVGWSLLAATIISAVSANLLGGALGEIAVAAVAGIVITSFEELAARRGSRDRLVAPMAAAAVAFGTVGLHGLWPQLATSLALIGSLIILVPGLEFTLAIKEISTENLVSGSARLTSAIGDFLLLAFGVALGSTLATAAFGPPADPSPVALPAWTAAIALPLVALGFGLRFRAHWRDLPWIVLACTVSFLAADVGSAWLGPDLGVFVAALAVGLAANARARFARTSSMVMMIPGLILLVPGSFGLRAAALMVQDDVVSALATVFSMLLIATALSTGLLLANLLLPSERGETPA